MDSIFFHLAWWEAHNDLSAFIRPFFFKERTEFQLISLISLNLVAQLLVKLERVL